MQPVADLNEQPRLPWWQLALVIVAIVLIQRRVADDNPWMTAVIVLAGMGALLAWARRRPTARQLAQMVLGALVAGVLVWLVSLLSAG